MSFLFSFWHILSTALIIVISCVLRRRYKNHRLSIRHISLTTLSFEDVRCEGTLYDGTYTYTFTSSRIAFRLHWPTPARPRWFTLTAHDIFYTSTTCDISLAALDVTGWFFPLLFRQTAGPWTSVQLDDFRIRIYKSSQTPLYIKKLRKNLVNAVLTGETIRVDDFWTSMQFAGLSESAVQHGAQPASVPNGEATHDAESDCDDDEYPESDDSYEGYMRLSAEDRARRAELIDASAGEGSKDEVRISSCVRQLHIDNRHGRMYTLGAVDAQLRRDWDTDFGSFVMVTKEARWVRVHRAYQREGIGWWPYVPPPLLTPD